VYKMVLGVSQEDPVRRWPFHIPARSAGHSAANPSARARQILLATSQDVAKL